MSDTLTLQAAALRLGISDAHLEELLGAGALPTRVQHGERCIIADDLERFGRDRERAHEGLRRLAEVVNEAEGGWSP